jgi:hypothetical protein
MVSFSPVSGSLSDQYGSQLEAVSRDHLSPAEEHDLRRPSPYFQNHGIGPPEQGEIVFQGKAHGKVHKAVFFNAFHDGKFEPRFLPDTIHKDVPVPRNPEGAGGDYMDIPVVDAPATQEFPEILEH